MDVDDSGPNAVIEGTHAALDPQTDGGGARGVHLRRVALVSMPFLKAAWPSIQLGLLKQIGVDRGHIVSSLHLHLDFAAQLGGDAYDRLCDCLPDHLGEWLFSLAAFGALAPDQDTDLLDTLAAETLKLLADAGFDVESLRSLREHAVPRYIDHLLQRIDWQQFAVVGFSSCFQQNTACFALASALKARFPQMVILFGGANFDGDMGVEWVRAMPFIDYAVIGEGDQAFPELLDTLRDGGDPALVPGVVCRRDGQVAPPHERTSKSLLDAAPVPDYREYFERLDALGFMSPAERRRIRIPFESARGCWWGEKHHCTFCGLNGKAMAFRAKSPERVMAELAEQARRHRCFEFFAVDNILEPSYLKDFFAQISSQSHDYRFFYEVKSNLTRAHLKTLSEGGTRYIQPGIESLSSAVLALMRKGVSGIQNVNLLRWARYYDIDVIWNLLYGFPGERVEDYREQAALMRQLHHLQPPSSRANRISMQRFSPIFDDRKSFPVRYAHPHGFYHQIYPTEVDLNRAAFHFDYEFEHSLADSALIETDEVVHAWRQAWTSQSRPSMQFRSAPGVIEIEDRRDPARPRAYSVEGVTADLYGACSDQPRSAATLQRLRVPDWSIDRIEAALVEFLNLGLMMREGSRFLSLALPASKGR